MMLLLLLLLLLVVVVMKTRVRAHIALAREAPTADVTAMWAVPRVNEPVLLQVRQLSERLGTHLTPERTLSRVSSQVYLYRKQTGTSITSDRKKY